MIEVELLKQLGWSDELIAETTRAAESLRHGEVHAVDVPEQRTFSISTSTLSVAGAVNNTLQEYRIPEPQPELQRKQSS